MTRQLRLRGVTPLQLMVAVVCAFPLVFLAHQVFIRHLVLKQPVLFLFAAMVASLPWLSRAAARAAYRAKCDDVGVYVRDELLPYKTITAVTVERSARRVVVNLQRGETVTVQLVLWDAFAGRLQPIDALAAKLAEHGHPLNAAP